MSSQDTGGRLMIRLTTQCNSSCAHCTVADIAHHPDKPAREALEEITAGRKRGCTELVFMRGEPTLRPDLLALARRARGMGYELVQVQTNGRKLAQPTFLKKLLAAGVNYFEVSLFGHVEALHDLIDGNPGAFKECATGIRNLARTHSNFLVTIPVIKRNFLVLPQITRRAAKLGATRIQFNFSRPVEANGGWNVAPLVSLTEASPWIRLAMREAVGLGLEATTEAVPLCHLDESSWKGAEIAEDFSRHQVSDLHRTEESMEKHRESSRPSPAICSDCRMVATCPTTWAAYQMLNGTDEFHPIS